MWGSLVSEFDCADRAMLILLVNLVSSSCQDKKRAPLFSGRLRAVELVFWGACLSRGTWHLGAVWGLSCGQALGLYTPRLTEFG